MKLFKNACILNIHDETAKIADILTENGKIKQIDKNIQCDCEKVDLKGNYAIPAFINSFCDSYEAVKTSYNLEIDEKLAQQLIVIKNLLAGAVVINDKPTTLDNIEYKSDKELEKLSADVAKSRAKLFMKVGQSLDELGAIDKIYGKTLSEVLEDFGFLDRDCVLVGGNCLEKDELQLLKRYDAKIVLTPNEDARLAKRAPNVLAMKNIGFDIGMGSGCCGEIDFFAFMRQLLQTQRMLFENADVLSEKEVFEMACNGNILGLKNEVAVGADANFAVVVRGKTLYKNPILDIIYTKCKKDVEMTIFKGEILQQSGKIFMQSLPQYDTIVSEIKSFTRR